MIVQIQWINHASFRITSGVSVLYVDPWKIDNEPHDADVVFVSHSHYDHCSKPDVQKVSKSDTVIIAPADTIRQIGATNAVEPGESMTIKEITIEAVAAYNIGKTFHPKGHQWCGAVFTIGGKRIYYAGDTDLVPEMSGLKNVDVALLPIGGTYTLDAAGAAKACQAIGCKIAIPYHWGDIVGSEADAKAFAAKAKSATCTPHVLQPGEIMKL